VQENERRTPSFVSSRRKNSKLSALSPKNILPPPSAPASHVHSESPDLNINSGGVPTLPDVSATAFLSARARNNMLMSAATVDPNVKSRAFLPLALPYHQSRSALDGSAKKVRTQEHLEKEERDTEFYGGAMDSTRGGRESEGHDFNPPAGLPISAARVPHLKLTGNPRQVCLTLAFVFSCRVLGWGSEHSVRGKTDCAPFHKYRQRRTNPTMIRLSL
jgi:hypothetical protein